ncbi:DUF1127 domain-containing protein [Biostraticola tofi]|uniref:Uncharacterized protein YjiS (DUF1127 family) n=1 Tax=Biostraticola tofi TaxID=466109 RepID=A0A4R3YPX8_9GAMM|nr:DUF1127 domain-containing protein [Biostraticola tofi]TCV93648.1 uncharacterized protein YjiS (DUF1127 family) [Biostraticola tofi]
MKNPPLNGIDTLRQTCSLEQQNKPRLFFLTLWLNRLSAWRAFRKNKNLLLALNDSQLKDIGLKREDIQLADSDRFRHIIGGSYPPF